MLANSCPQISIHRTVKRSGRSGGFPVLELRKLTKRLGETAVVSEVSVTIPVGQMATETYSNGLFNP